MATILTSPATKGVEELLGTAAVRRAFAFFDAHGNEIIEEHIRICSIPAPPFGESARAEYLATEEALRGVLLSLVSDVAIAYMDLRELD